MIYDIFISYKRKGASSATAAYLYELLLRKGYNVFFDRKELRSGNFNTQLLEHISNATDIIILLEEESLGSWFDNRDVSRKPERGEDVNLVDKEIDSQEEPYQTDWFCREVMHALSLEGKNIIPLLLNGYKMPDSKDLPPEMRELSLKNALPLEISEIEEFYQNYFVEKEYLKSKPKNLAISRQFQNKGAIVGSFLFYTEANSCELYERGNRIFTLTDDNDEDHPFEYPITFAGEHRFKLQNNDTCEIVNIRKRIEANCQEYIHVEWTQTMCPWDLSVEEIQQMDDIKALCYYGKCLYEGTSKHEPDIVRSYECLKRALELGSDDAKAFFADHGKGLVIEKNASNDISAKWYELSSLLGNPMAHYNLGTYYEKGMHYEQNYEKAFEKYQMAADGGFAMAYSKLGAMYYFGYGVEKNIDKAVSWSRKAAEEGDSLGLRNLADMYFDGEGVEKDFNIAIDLYSKAAEQGSIGAMTKLGVIYSNGTGVDQNYDKAQYWWTRAASEGSVISMVHLGMMYTSGKPVTKDYQKAFDWFRKAAEKGNPIAQERLGWLYTKGLGVEQDYEKSFELCSKAAERDNINAQRRLGWMYENGKGVSQNSEKAFEWYSKAAEKENTDAQVRLGSMYANGKGVAQDYSKAYEWWSKAETKGNPSAQERLGWLYANGFGVEQDYAKAFEYWSLSAENNNSSAMVKLGWMYQSGKGVKRDYQMAFEWYNRAAAIGNSEAQVRLGALYMAGKVVDVPKAIQWFEMSAMHGTIAAYRELASAYCFQREYEKALPWAEKAVESNHDNPDVIDTYATILQGLGRYPEALEQLFQCLHLYSEKDDEKGTAETKQKIDELKSLMNKK